MDRHLVSVIIPVYNGEAFLAEAVESILRQSYKPLEIIIVDDGSTDNTRKVAEGFEPEVRYIFQPNRGAAAARNQGVELAEGSFLAFIDHDDLWMEDKLARQLAAFDDEPELEIVFGHIKQFISPELEDSIKDRIHCPAEKMPGYCATTMLTRLDSFLRVGPFETGWKVGEFIDWHFKAVDKGLKCIMLREVVAKRRIHRGNTSLRERKSRSDFLKIIQSSLDRRRKINS